MYKLEITIESELGLMLGKLPVVESWNSSNQRADRLAERMAERKEMRRQQTHDIASNADSTDECMQRSDREQSRYQTKRSMNG